MSRPAATAGLSAVLDAVGHPDVDAEDDAVGFVHVARGGDPDRRYLTGTDRPSREAALVVAAPPERERPVAVYGVPSSSRAAARVFLAGDDAADRLDRRVAFRPAGTTAGSHAVSVLEDCLGSAAGAGSVLSSRRLPHDAALELEAGGYTLASTTALVDRRAVKTPVERSRLETVQRAVTGGLDRAVETLAESDAEAGTLRSDGEPLDAHRLETAIRVELARAGVTPAGVSVRVADGVGGTASAGPAEHAPATAATGGESTATTALPTGKPIEIRILARGRGGYYGHRTHTLVVDSDGGWDRRAFVACEAALGAALGHCNPGTAVRTARAEAVAELAAYGFSSASDGSERKAGVVGTAGAESTTHLPPNPGASAFVHGVGLAPTEAPGVDDDGVIRAGAVLVVGVAVSDPDHGAVRLATIVDCDDRGDDRDAGDGGAELVAYPAALTPTATRSAATDAGWPAGGDRGDHGGRGRSENY